MGEGTTTVTIQAILDQMTVVLQAFYNLFGNLVDTIVNNPILAIVVIFSFAFSLVSFALVIVRKMGLRGMSAGGRRRRRRRV